MSGHLTNSTYPSSLTVSGGFTGVVLTRTICTSLMNTLECMTCFKTKKEKRGEREAKESRTETHLRTQCAGSRAPGEMSAPNGNTGQPVKVSEQARG